MTFVVAVIAAALFCFAVAIRDFRRKDYIWSAMAFLSGVILLAVPIPTQATKVDLGTATGPQDHTSSTSRP